MSDEESMNMSVYEQNEDEQYTARMCEVLPEIEEWMRMYDDCSEANEL